MMKREKDTAKEIDLSMIDFARYFEQKRLGRLYVTNGRVYDPQKDSIMRMSIDLTDLYKLVLGGMASQTPLSLDDIVAVIAFGPAVQYPDWKKVPYTSRQYWLVGKYVTRSRYEYIRSDQVDFLVITKPDLVRDESLEPVTDWFLLLGKRLVKCGIHIQSVGVDKFLSEAQDQNSVSALALREGVPVFFHEMFPEIAVKTKIKRTNPRGMFWEENKQGLLAGWIGRELDYSWGDILVDEHYAIDHGREPRIDCEGCRQFSSG
jgi:hypothetical protein